jgi:ferredoxin
MRTIIYFSPTGNVKYLAGKLAYQLDSDSTDLLPLEFTDPDALKLDDQLVLMYSIHAFNPPRTVRRFVKNMPAGLYKNISLISVGCAESWVNKAASSGLRKILERKAYSVLVDEIMAMPLSFIMSFPEDLIRKQISTADEKIELIAKSILNGKASENEIPGKSRLLHTLGKAEGPAARLFGLELHAGKGCTSCGVCVRNCPEKNIHFNKKNKPAFGIKCLMCMRCIYNCPEKVISPRISKFIPIKNGYSIFDYLKNEGS